MVIRKHHPTIPGGVLSTSTAGRLAEPSTLDCVRLAVEHLTTALTGFALLRVVHLPVGDASHVVSVVVPRSVAHKQILWVVVPLYFIDVVYGLPGPQEPILSLHD